LVNLQKIGGIAALLEALVYLVGFAVVATLFNPGDLEAWSQEQKLSYLLQRRSIFQTWNIFIYVVFGAILVVLTVALHERLRTKAGALISIATSFGLIWSGLVIASGMVASVGLEMVTKLYAQDAGQALAVWAAVGAVQDGLGGGVEIVGGLWILLVSAASYQTHALPRLLCYLGFVVGLAGLLTVAPPLGELGAVFGLVGILWFAWIGVVMLQQREIF
jgi:hypothetical protein